MEVSGQVYASTALSQGKSHWYSLNKRRGVSYGKNVKAKRKIPASDQNRVPAERAYTHTLYHLNVQAYRFLLQDAKFANVQH